MKRKTLQKSANRRFQSLCGGVVIAVGALSIACGAAVLAGAGCVVNGQRGAPQVKPSGRPATPPPPVRRDWDSAPPPPLPPIKAPVKKTPPTKKASQSRNRRGARDR